MVKATRYKLGKTQFGTSLDYGRTELNEYWEKMMNSTPYYYAAAVVNPKLGMGWFDTWWKDHPTWITSVKKGMKELYQKYVKEMKNAGVVEVVDERAERRKLSASVLKQRAAYKAMGIVVDSDDEDSFTAVLHVAASCSLRTTSTSRKAAKTEATELERWNRLLPTEDVDNPLEF